MLLKKESSELIEPLNVRIEKVKIFLNIIRQSGTRLDGRDIHYNVISISDNFGPTREDSTCEAIVGSEETRKGCEAGKFFLLHFFFSSNMRNHLARVDSMAFLT